MLFFVPSTSQHVSHFHFQHVCTGGSICGSGECVWLWRHRSQRLFTRGLSPASTWIRRSKGLSQGKASSVWRDRRKEMRITLDLCFRCEILISLRFGAEQQEETPLRTSQAVLRVCADWAKCQNANSTPRGYQMVHKRLSGRVRNPPPDRVILSGRGT